MKRLVNSPLKILGLLAIAIGILITVLTYGYLIVLGLILTGVGLTSYLIDYAIRSFSKNRRIFWAGQVICTMLYISTFFVAYMEWQEHNKIVFPKEFKGQAGIIFGIEGYPELPKTMFWKKTIIIPDDGILITSTKMEDVPNIVRFAFSNNTEIDPEHIIWNPNSEMDCIVSDSKIEAWLFQIESESAAVKDLMTSLCNEIASNKKTSMYKSLDRAISSDGNGQHLRLLNRDLTSLPDGLEKFSLYEIILTGNNFNDVPEQILQITSLEHLIMAVNPIIEFPCKITQLKRLKSVSFAETGIKQINCDLSLLDSLEHFDLSRNGLATFPERIKSIPNLTWLSLHDNQLTDFSFIDSRLSKLETLDLYSNKIKSMSAETRFLGNLKELLLFDNEIDRIPDNISDLKHLEKLEIWDNPIQYISPNISRLTKLKAMRIDDDYLTQKDKDNLKKWLPNCKISFQTRREKKTN
ncbi:leucine-rich repeat domain-containing protein [Sphingobacterium suaedae]|uniref:Leucine-rich repeat domain-containing protein n=1 Tax=Sphingobacterium suaedae TaxID=1686402 RepID=A0ABW5KE48_9SPHI